MAKGTCLESGCEAQLWSRQMCKKHYMRDYHTGALKPRTFDELFWPQVDKTESCWNWTGNLANGGYGRYGKGGRLAHRLAYEKLVGPIPAGMHLDHRCHNRRCVNPEHLRPVTTKQNAEHRSSDSSGSGGVRGVHWDAAREKWVVLVTHNYKCLYFGGYDTVEEANRIAIAKRNELFTHNDFDRIDECASD